MTKIELQITLNGDISLHHDAGENVRVTVLPPDGIGYDMNVASGVHTLVSRVRLVLAFGGFPKGAVQIAKRIARERGI